MSLIEKQVRRAKVRLNSNVLLERLALGVVVAAVLWSVALLLERVFALGLPLWPLIAAAAGVAVIVTSVTAYLARASALQAAVAIDSAAGLKERVSTALGVLRSNDDFARAALKDAEKVAGSVHVPTHLPLKAPTMWPWSAATIVVALALYAFMPQLNLLAGQNKGNQSPEEKAAVADEQRKVEVALAEQYNKVQKMAEANPELKDVAKDLEALQMPVEPSQTPEDVRRDALKKIDKLTEKLAEKKDSDQFRALDEVKRRFAQLDPKQAQDPASKLTQALADGDMKAAQEQMRDMKKQMEEAAEKSDEETKQKLTEMAAKLEDLAQQMEKLADQSKMQKELENKAGMSEAEATKLLEEVSKMDPKQMQKELQKRLGEKGMDAKQIEEMAKKLQQNEAAKKAMQEMAKQMQKASDQCKKQCQGGQQQKQGQPQQGNGEGDPQQGEGDAMADAMQQLSEMEMAEQMQGELQAQLQELDDMREGMCEGNQGKGRGKKNNEIGEQGGNEGLGYGAKVGKDTAAHGYKASKEKPRSQGGQIIGQMLIDGPQVKGEVGTEVKEAVNSAQRDASDAIEKESVPRQYHDVLKKYFDSLAGLRGGGATARPGKAGTTEARKSDVKPSDED